MLTLFRSQDRKRLRTVFEFYDKGKTGQLSLDQFHVSARHFPLLLLPLVELTNLLLAGRAAATGRRRFAHRQETSNSAAEALFGDARCGWWCDGWCPTVVASQVLFCMLISSTTSWDCHRYGAGVSGGAGIDLICRSGFLPDEVCQ